MRPTRDYITDDCDLNKNRLEIFQGENGDWYVQTLKEGQRLGAAVRITTSGGPYAHKVSMAIYQLYEAMKRDEIDDMIHETKVKK